MKVEGRGPFFCFGGISCKNKGSQEPSAPIPTHRSPAEHFHPPAQHSLAHEIGRLSCPRDPVAFLTSKDGRGRLRSGVQKEKEGRQRSFEDSTRRCIPRVRMNGTRESPRLANSLGEKPHGADRGCGQFRNGDRQTDNPPQEQGGAFVGDPGGRELGSAELGAQNG